QGEGKGGMAKHPSCLRHATLFQKRAKRTALSQIFFINFPLPYLKKDRNMIQYYVNVFWHT
ncbi:MAG: hypothetical protein IJD03_05180, partial [Clostridia bacterium]|nr:hypothetical protein [Clostridia bacterium]